MNTFRCEDIRGPFVVGGYPWKCLSNIAERVTVVTGPLVELFWRWQCYPCCGCWGSTPFAHPAPPNTPSVPTPKQSSDHTWRVLWGLWEALVGNIWAFWKKENDVLRYSKVLWGPGETWKKLASAEMAISLFKWLCESLIQDYGSLVSADLVIC